MDVAESVVEQEFCVEPALRATRNRFVVGFRLQPTYRVRKSQLTKHTNRQDLKRPVVDTLPRWIVPNIGRQLILKRCIHGIAEQFQSGIRPEGNSALHDQPLLVIHDDFQALELVAVHGPHPAQKGGALIELKLACIGAGTTRSARLSENRRADVTPLDGPYQDPGC
jgi:hypothetical protein